MKSKKLRWHVWFYIRGTKPVSVEALNKDEAEQAASAKSKLPRSSIVELFHLGRASRFNQPEKKRSRQVGKETSRILRMGVDQTQRV